jgi:hypothetical protein
MRALSVFGLAGEMAELVFTGCGFGRVNGRETVVACPVTGAGLEFSEIVFSKLSAGLPTVAALSSGAVWLTTQPAHNNTETIHVNLLIISRFRIILFCSQANPSKQDAAKDLAQWSIPLAICRMYCPVSNDQTAQLQFSVLNFATMGHVVVDTKTNKCIMDE